MTYHKRKNLLASIMTVLRSMEVKAWVHEGDVRHNGPEEMRNDIKANLERVRQTGVRGTALYFGAVLLTAMDRGCFTHRDIKKLDPMGLGNATYILEKLEENGE